MSDTIELIGTDSDTVELIGTDGDTIELYSVESVNDQTFWKLNLADPDYLIDTDTLLD